MTSREWTIVLAVVLGVLVLLPVLGMAFGGFGMMGSGWGQGWGPGMMGPGMMGGYGGGFGGFGLLMLLLLVAGIVLIVLAFTRRETRPDDALAVLKQRLARGEITREQYEELKQVLQ